MHELVLPLDASGQFVLDPSGRYGPLAPLWTYTTPALYSGIQSSAQRLPNGNTLICSADQSWIFEVEGTVVVDPVCPSPPVVDPDGVVPELEEGMVARSERQEVDRKLLARLAGLLGAASSPLLFG